MIHRYRVENFKSMIDVTVDLSPVEGEADAGAVPILIKLLLTDLHAWDAVFRFADGQPVVCLDPRFWEL